MVGHQTSRAQDMTPDQVALVVVVGIRMDSAPVLRVKDITAGHQELHNLMAVAAAVPGKPAGHLTMRPGLLKVGMVSRHLLLELLLILQAVDHLVLIRGSQESVIRMEVLAEEAPQETSLTRHRGKLHRMERQTLVEEVVLQATAAQES